MSQEIDYEPFKHNVGFDGVDVNNTVFALRNLTTIENEWEAKYSFNNKSGINISVRHYWSEVDKQAFFRLLPDGKLLGYEPAANYKKENFSFNQFSLFAEYSRQFAPGSFINLVWKNENVNWSNLALNQYFKNLNTTLTNPHGNNISIRIIYYMDYLNLKSKKEKNL